MTVVGPSLSDLRREQRSGRLSLSTTVRIAVNCLTAVRNMHDIGFVHRDIKPSNFTIGMLPPPLIFLRIWLVHVSIKFCIAFAPLAGCGSRAEIRKIYLIDFGLSRQFLKTLPDGTQIIRAPRRKVGFRGTNW